MNELLSREKFLKTTALAGAALLVSSLEGWASALPDKKLRVAVIGCGSVSNRYLPTTQLPAFVETIADENPLNPIAEWIRSIPWDGVDRLPDFCDTLTVREGYPLALRNLLVRKWLLSAVAAVLMPRGFKARGVLTLQGDQGLGKTTWIVALVPDTLLRDCAVKVDHHLDASNKDSTLIAISHWMVEIGELDSSFRKDVARLKQKSCNL